MKRLFIAACLALIAAIPPVLAFDGSRTAQVIPATVYVAADWPATFTVTWQIPVTTGPGVSSPSGSFVPALGSVPAALNQMAGAGTTAIITESVRVPLAVIQKALATGASFIYRRNFFETAAEAGTTVDLTIKITGAQAAGLSASRQATAFDDNTPVRIVAPRQRLGAWSEVTLSGSGLVEGVWEIAEPSTTSGQAVFHTLQVVRRFAQSGTALRLDSPTLPTGASGLHLLRLRLTQPLPGFEAPEIRYFVTQAGAASGVRAVQAASPQPGALLEDATRFTWALLPGVHSWLLVLHARPGLAGNLPELGATAAPGAAELAQLANSTPAAGIVVPGQQTGTALSAMTRTRLKSGSAYLWRVLGVDQDGVVLGESAWREIRVP